jgi:site-specific recombinase XerD
MMPKPRLDKQQIAVANIKLLLDASHSKKKDLAEYSYIGDHISRLLPDGYAAHTLRHRFATTAYAATHDLFVVAELLGHESVETTEHYVAMPDGRLREAMAAVRLI